MLQYLIPSFIVFAILLRLSYNAFGSEISDIPGPWICKFTNLYRIYRSWRGDAHIWLQELKAQYGNLVRIGPNVILDSERGEIQSVFGFKEDYAKSEGIEVWQAVINGKRVAGIASTRSKVTHAKWKRPIAALYSNTNVISYQPRVTETIKYFMKRLDEEFIEGNNADRRCDIDNWVQYFAFDIVGQLTISRRLGFLELGHDVEDMLMLLNEEFDYRAAVQSMPILDRFLRKNPLYLRFKNPTTPFAQRSRNLIIERMRDEKHDGVDFLDGFLEAQKKHPEVVDQNLLNSYISTNFLAGSDTTAVTMRTIIWYVLKTPGVLERLRKELDQQIMVYPPDYNTAQSLKYLDAVVREALRIHPIAPFVLERVIPHSGHTTPSGRRLPPGTIIGQSAWTLHFDEDIWGPQPHDFRPERWLKYEDETTEAYEKRVGQMKHHDFSFSYGPRACLGKHIAWMEIIEVIPTLFGLLDMELADPNKQWTVRGAFFSRQSDMDITMRWRHGVDKTQVLS